MKVVLVLDVYDTRDSVASVFDVSQNGSCE